MMGGDIHFLCSFRKRYTNRMNTKVIIAFLVLVLVAGAGWLGFEWKGMSTKEDSSDKKAVSEKAPAFRWEFTDQTTADATAPRTAVVLFVDDRKVDVGSFDGTCVDASMSGWEMVEGALASAICYWAGAGDEIAIFKEGSSYVVKKGVIEEGTAESAGIRGNFQTLLSL